MINKKYCQWKVDCVYNFDCFEFEMEKKKKNTGILFANYNISCYYKEWLFSILFFSLNLNKCD